MVKGFGRRHLPGECAQDGGALRDGEFDEGDPLLLTATGQDAPTGRAFVTQSAPVSPPLMYRRPFTVSEETGVLRSRPLVRPGTESTRMVPMARPT
jgi:hypothetical protein